MRPLTRLTLTCLAVLIAAAAPTTSALARRGGRTSFRDKTAGVQIFLPATWKRQWRSAFPGVLVTFKHQKHDARFLLAVKQRKSDVTLVDMAKRSATVLGTRKWRVDKITTTRLGKLPAVEFIATNPKGTLQVRQLYAFRDKFAYVMTLVSPPTLAVRLRVDFLFVQKSARFAR